MGYPLLCRTAERLTGSGKRTVPSIFVGAYLAVHLYAIHQFLFTPYGPTHRTYAAELKNWNILLKQTANEATTYEADNTPFAGLHPLHRKTITSERHPDEVYRNLNWLDPEKYPWLDKNRFPIREDEDDH